MRPIRFLCYETLSFGSADLFQIIAHLSLLHLNKFQSALQKKNLDFKESIVVSASGCCGALTCWQSPSGDNEKDAYANHAHPPQLCKHTTITATAYTAAPVRAAFKIRQSNEGWHSTFPQCFLYGREA